MKKSPWIAHLKKKYKFETNTRLLDYYTDKIIGPDFDSCCLTYKCS